MGGSSVCGLDMNGALWCWGMIKLNGNMKVDRDTFGTLAWVPEMVTSTAAAAAAAGDGGGDGGGGTTTTTQMVYSQVSVGGDGVVCALLATDGQAMCFGSGGKGQNGDGTREKRTTPVLVKAGNSFSQISCGQAHVCGLLLNGGQAACWGGNEFGQLGDGTREDKSSPVAVQGGVSFSRIACGDTHTCAVVEETGEGMCWGGNTVGQLGDGSNADQTEPVLVQGGYSYGSLNPGAAVGNNNNNNSNNDDGTTTISSSSSGNGVGVIVGGVIGSIITLTVMIAIAVKRLQRRRRQTTTNAMMLQSPSSSGMMNSKSPLTDGSSRSSNEGDGFIKGATHRDVIRADPVLMWAMAQAAGASVVASQQGKGKTTIAAAAGGGGYNRMDTTTTTTTDADNNDNEDTSKQEKDGTSSTNTNPGGVKNRFSGGDSSSGSAGSGHGHGHGCLEINFLDLNIIEKLGEGGFGAVYRAMYNQTKVAAKVLMSRPYDVGYSSIYSTAASASTTASIQKKVDKHLLIELEKEAGLMSSPAMRHRNIIQIIGVSLQPPTIITDYCERGSLMDTLYLIKVNNIPLPWPLRLDMMLGAARGMLHLHTRSPPIIHRDLKSPNLLVTRHWEVKIADFNLSKLLPDNTTTNNNNNNNNGGGGTNAKSPEGPGNPRWLAPECLMGMKATAAADVFAFGIVMNEMLMCELPWAGVPGLKIISQVLVGERPKFLHGYICGLSRRGIGENDNGDNSGEASPPPSPPSPPPGYEEYVGLMKQCWAQSQKERPDFNTITSVLNRLHEQSMPNVGGGGGGGLGRGSGGGGERKE